jgi:hypothetical protein
MAALDSAKVDTDQSPRIDAGCDFMTANTRIASGLLIGAASVAGIAWLITSSVRYTADQETEKRALEQTRAARAYQDTKQAFAAIAAREKAEQAAKDSAYERDPNIQVFRALERDDRRAIAEMDQRTTSPATPSAAGR